MSSIKDLWEKIKGFLVPSDFKTPKWSDDLFLILVIVLVAFGSFGLGRLSKIEEQKAPIRIENAPVVTPQTFPAQSTEATSLNKRQVATPEAVVSNEQGTYVASKTGTKYHYPWCPGAQRISEGNRIYFNSKEEAEARGYTAASNCKGL